MADGFFSDVAEPIRVRRTRLDRPAVVQGLRARPARPRQADGGPPPDRRLPVALVRLAGLATCSASGRSTGRGSTRASTRWPPPATKMAAAFEFLEKLGVPFYCFHDRDVAPEGATFAEFRANLDALDRRRARLPGADRRHGCCGARPTCSPTRATRPARRPTPTPRCSPTPRRRSSTMLEVTQRLGGANYVLWGGREGYDTLLNTDLAREGDQLARFLHLVAEHKHRIGFKGTLLIEPKPMEPTKHQYDYDVGDRPRLPRPQRPRGRVPGQHRGEPRDARRPQLPPRGRLRGRATASSAASTPTAATRRTAGTPTSSRTRSRTWRLPLYEILTGGGFTTGGFNFDAKLRRQSMDRTDLFHAHIGGIDTLARALLVAADLIERGTLDAAARGALRGLGRPARPGDPGRRRDRSSRSRRRVAPARSTRARCRAARSCSRTSSTSTIWAAERDRIETGAGR